MPNLNPNSTNYVHSSEPNTNDLTMAMDYNDDGKPALRVLSNIQGDITIDGDVNIPGIVTVTNTDDDPLFTHTHLYDENDAEYTTSNPLTIDGTVTIQDGGNSISIDDGGNVITVDGTVDIGNEVAINDGGNSITVDGTVSITGGSGAFPSEVIATDPYGASVIRIDDTTKQHTSKNRVKMSTYEVTDFATFTTGKDPDIWDELTTGTASATHDEYLGMIKLEVGSDAGDQVIRQTKRVQRYIPGRQGEVSMTMIFGTPTTGVRRRFGLFDELNGFFFEDSGDGTYRCCLRRNTSGGVVNENIARDDWNVDKLDGTGPSGITADPTAIQHMSIEYEWYGAGMIEWNFIIENNKYPIHRIYHGNTHDHTWSSKAALPVRIELTNVAGTAGTHTYYQGSHSFSVEGTTELLGRQQSIANPITGRNLGTANTFTPLVAIRLKSDALDSVVLPDEFAACTLDNTNIFIRAIEDATITGGTWVSFSDDSAVEYNITATGFSNGTIIGTTYVSSGNQGEKYTFPQRSITQIQRSTTTTLGDTSGTFLIAVAATGSNKEGWASLGWIEVR